MTNLHLFFDGGSIPSGWTLVSDSGNPFYQRFVRGYSVYGGTGGSVTHTHVASKVSCDGPSATNDVNFDDCLCMASCTHTHSNGTTASADNIPVSKSLKVIKYNTGIPVTIPTGAIAVFDSSVPSGWTRYSVYDDKFIYCDHTVDVSHGAETHLHSSFTVGGCSAGEYGDRNETGIRNMGWIYHTHTVSVSTNSVSNRPPYLSVILGRSNSDNVMPLGMIGMFDGTPSGWEVLSGSGGDFYEKFILPSASYGTTGGSATHNHPNIYGDTGGPSVSGLFDSGYDRCGATSTHTHWVQYSFQQTSNLPPYIDVIFAKNLTRHLTATDSSTGADFGSYVRPLTATDSSVGVDISSVSISCTITDSCSAFEVPAMTWSFNISDTCTLPVDEAATVLGYTAFTDSGIGAVTGLVADGYCNPADSCSAVEYLYQEVAHPWYDTGTFIDKIGQCRAELTVRDEALHTEYANVYLSLDETVGRMMWRFSTAYDKTSSSNLTTLTTVLASELTKLEFTDILGESNHFVDYASGTSLNYIGALFSLSRKADESDRNYRMRIKTAPLIAGGTRSSLKTAISTVLGVDEELISVVDDYKGADDKYGHITIEFDVSNGIIEYDEATFLTIVNRNKAAGVKIDDVKSVEKYTLTFVDAGDGCHRADITEIGSLNWVCDE